MKYSICCLLGTLYFGISVASAGADPGIEITTKSGTDLEEKGVEQLERLLSEYSLDAWVFTKNVRIQSDVIPHSHPVLTLNTQYLDQDAAQLATFLHEQIHWYLIADENDQAFERSMAAFRSRYPDIPEPRQAGTQSDFSTYLHLMVCWLEMDALSRLIGEDKARQLISEKTYYKWVYEQVLDDNQVIGDLLRAEGLVIEN